MQLFSVPGWDSTDGPDAQYPPFSRVNHAKFIVSDTHATISTSNMAWDYYYRTAGAAITLQQEGGVRAALEAVFERDWHSSMATDLE